MAGDVDLSGAEPTPAEEADRRGAARLRELADLADAALLAVARDGRILGAGAQAAVLTGLAPEAIAGVNLLDLVEPEARGALATILARARPDARLTLSDLPLTVAGAARRVDVAAVGRRTEPDEVLVSLRDVTERWEMREEIRNARSFFANLIQNSVECVIAADMQGTIILFNDGAERLLGHCARDVIGKLHITRIYKDPARAHEVMKLLRRSDHGGTGRLDDTVQVAVSAAGEEIPVRIRAAIIYQDGKEVATVGYFHDMRERLSMERQLRETQTQLLQAEKMSSLGKLAAGIAHQINNPLAGIMLAGHLLQERHGVDPDAREELESIIENANRCREIVKDLLGFARQTRRQVAPMDLNRALERTLFLLVNQPLFHNIRIERRLQPDLPALQADEQQLNQVFMNLILNAAEAMGGRGTLAVRTRRADEDLVEFEIEDTGCGIRPEVLSHIFEPFFTTKPPGKGTGLGLSVAYGIVAQHGGAIDVRSREGLGTTFCVRLPLRPGVTEEPPP